MRELGRLVRAEFWKMRRTLLPWIHVLVPLLGISVFLFYYRLSRVSDEGKISGYIQTIAIVFPLVISMVCCLSVEIEEQGHFQTFLWSAVHKKNSLLAKWLVLSGMGLAALILAVGGFAAGYWIMTGNTVYGKWEYLCITAALWLSGSGLYLLHLFLNLSFSRNISLCAGTAELLVAALFLTGLGEGLWQFFPCSWGSRWSGYLLLYWKGNLTVSAGFLGKSLGICVCLWAALCGLIFLWFHYYESTAAE